MKIRTQLIAGLVIFALLLAIITGLVFTTNQQVERLTAQEDMANTIALEVGELGYLSNDYILYREPRQVDRWDAKFASLSGHAGALSVDDPEQQAIVGNLQASLRNTRSIFDEITASPVQPGGAAETGFVQLSWSRMAVQNQGMVFDAGRLAHLLREQVDGLRQASLLLISLLVVAFSGFLLTSYFLFYRRTLRSITDLREGARRIGSGDLDHTIGRAQDDEIGDLAREFNRMTASLKTVTAKKSDLETEMAERKRAEEAFRVSEQRLREVYGSMIEGLANHDMVYEDGKATDYVITDVNPAFERIFGLSRADVVGKRASAVYGTGNPPYLELYERVASGGFPEYFESYYPPMEKHFAISVFSPGKGRFATVFQDITDRKFAEEARERLNAELTERARELEAANEALLASRRAALNIMEDAIQARDALAESEARYRTVADNTYDWEFWLDPEGKFIYCSPSCETITGHRADEFFADPGLRWTIIYPDDFPGFEEHQKEVHGKQDAGRGEWRYVRPDGTSCWIEHVCQPVYGAKGEFLGIRGSNRDITLRKQAEQGLRDSEERYRALVDSAPEAILVHYHGKVLYANQVALDLYGASSLEEMKSHDVMKLIPPDELEIASARVTDIDRGKRLPMREGAILRLDGTRVPMEAVSSPIRYEGILAAQVLMRDITERKQAEESLRASEERFHAIAANTPDHILMQDRDLRYTLVINPQLGLTVEDMIGKTDFDVFTKEDAEKLTGIKRRVLETGTSVQVSMPATAKDGSIQHFEGTFIPRSDAKGSTIGLIGYFRNITEPKKAEERIAHLASFPELNPNPVIELNSAGEVLYANPGTTRVLGSLGLGNNPGLFLPGDLPTMLPRLLEGDVAEEVKVGEKVFLETITLNPSTRTTRIYARDITDRKRAEEALRETSEHLESLINNANAPIIVWDPEFRITRFNHAFERLTGRQAAEVMGKSLVILFPAETAAGSMDYVRKAMAGEQMETVEIPILHRDGSVKTVLWNSATLYEADGKTVSSAIAQGQDITERKQFEEALHDTSQYLENLINYANAPIIVWDPDFRITRFNHAFERLTGRTAGEVMGRELVILFPADTAAESMDLIRKAMAGERWEIVEIPVLHRDGGIRTVLWNSATLYEADGVTPSSAIAQGMDITEQKRMAAEVARKANELAEANAELSAEIAHRKKAEEEVRRALSTLNAALESTADAMLVIDRSGRITSYNQNFTTMWNVPESVLKTLDKRIALEHLSVQVRDPDGFMDRMKEVSDHPARESFDMLELLDGRIIERYSKPQKIGPSIVGRVYSFRDITERKHAELLVIQSLEEKEVLLREIHHRVKNNLQLTTSLLDMTRMRTTDPTTSSILTDVMLKVQTMAQIHTRLYESKQFDRINMDSQIRDQVRALTSIYSRGDREITSVIDSGELYLPLDQAIPCALALNEILSNAFKHAFRGRRRGTVKYSAGEEDGRIRFTISDDGVGLPKGFELSKANSLGLKLVRTLVEQQLKGTLRIKGVKGTEVLVEIPRKGEEEHV